MLLVEFTIEPFVEGQPGPHVTSAVAAVEALGVTVEFGPFGSSCSIDESLVGSVTAAITAAAFANGATHLTIDAERVEDDPFVVVERELPAAADDDDVAEADG